VIASDGVRYLYLAYSSSFVRYDPITQAVATLPSFPGGALDRWGGMRVTDGPYSGRNLYRYSIDRNTWTAEVLPFDVNDGGMGYLPAPVPGIYFVQGEVGSAFARFVLPGLLRVTPPTGEVQAGGTATLTVEFDAAGLGESHSDHVVRIDTNDPLQPRLEVPVSVNVVIDR